MNSLANTSLFTPLKVGSIGVLKHRVVLAPLTRMRATEPKLTASDLAVEYYRQRASDGGLLITEATNISTESLAYPSIPGIWSAEQTEAWKRVTDAVHSKKGFIVCQLWHTGRVAHSSYKDHPVVQSSDPLPGVSSSDAVLTNADGSISKVLTYEGQKPAEPPRPLRTDEIPRLLQDYHRATVNAKKAGFDGVEIHGAHGYLLNQFLDNSINKRTDQYGGSVENRARLLLEVVEECAKAWEGDIGRIAIRLSPDMDFYGTRGTDQPEVFKYVLQELGKRYNHGMAYILLTEDRWKPGAKELSAGCELPIKNGENYRQFWKGTLMGGGGFNPNNVAGALTPNGPYDLIAFGRWFISNPDLPERLRQGVPLNVYNRKTFYFPFQEEGFVDYPDLQVSSSFMQKDKYEVMNQKDIGSSLSSKV
jgi:N-ethylmaleimide reductase